MQATPRQLELPPDGSAAAPFLQRPRQASRERHACLEAQWPLLDAGLSRDAYRRFAGRFLGYYAPLEVRLLSLPWCPEVGLNVTRT